ncbi:MAG: ABC transporter permease, partial [Kiloniellales bacterium]|nr:ABC transporter permease [Kiloniellales bacterium]
MAVLAKTSQGGHIALPRRISSKLYIRPRLVLLLFLIPPILWLGVIYLGSLFSLLAQSFFYIDGFTGQVVREFSLRSYEELLTSRANLDVILRTATMAISVTIAAALIAFPIAYYMA